MEYMLLTYHDENRQGTADRPATKIEITEEMIDAGVRAMSCFHPHDPPEAIVRAVVSAAIRFL